MEFAEFARRVKEIEDADSDLEITDLVASLFEDSGEELPIVARFVQGRVFPGWSSRTLDIGPSLCYEAIARAAGPNVSADDVEDRLAETGDIGAVAASFDLDGQAGLGAFGDGSRNERSVQEVFETLDRLAAADGEGSQDRKMDLLFSLFNRCSAPEGRVLARLVLGEMRIGVGEGTVRDAIVEAFLEPSGTGQADDSRAGAADGARDPSVANEPNVTTLDAFEGDDEVDPAEHSSGPHGQARAEKRDGSSQSARAIDDPTAVVRRALQVSNDYGLVAETARSGGPDALDEIELHVGRPVKAMLAQAGTVREAVEDWEAVAVEPKYDGARVQVHYDGDDVELYSRNMETVTDPLPEVVEFVETHCGAPAILDGEVVAVDDDGAPLPFQEVLRRFRRKHDIAAATEEVAVEFYAFDCLYSPARSPDLRPGEARRGEHAEDIAGSSDAVTGTTLLDEPLSVRHAHLDATLSAGVVDRTVTDDVEEIERIEADALSAGHEGVMLKNPDSTYTPGSRGQHWRKRKPDVETLDLVVTGGQWGEGRRANLLGTFEVSAVDDDGFTRLGNVATGITDEELESLTELLEGHVRTQEGQSVDLDPAVVFEVGYEEIQRSPDNDSGYALRFPRFVGVRPDKDPEDADRIDRVEQLANDE